MCKRLNFGTKADFPCSRHRIALIPLHSKTYKIMSKNLACLAGIIVGG